MALTLKLDDIKPLLGAVGLGEDPTPAPKPVNNIPPPPMQLPPTPAAAGFTEWASDPQNAKKVSDGITQPGTPLLPPVQPPQMASVTPPNIAPPGGVTPTPTPNIAPPTMQQDMAANPGQYQHPTFAKGRGVVGNGLTLLTAGLTGAAGGLGNKDPLAGVNWVNQERANDAAIPAANASTYDLRNVKPLRDAAQLEDVKSQTNQRNALAEKANQTAADLVPVPLTKEQAAAINQPALEGTGMTPRDYNRLVGLAGNNNTSKANNAATNDTRAQNNANSNDTKKTIADQKTATQKAIADAANKTKTLLQGMRDSTSRANNENTNANRGKTGDNFKVPADVTKRAALASNVLENADAVDQIITRRPDIIGAAGGRYSNVQQMIGSDDPDIQALGVRMHNMALASNGAHGVRAQQAIQKTEDELFGNFKAGPDAIRGALGATRGSMQTFLNDEQNFQTTGKRGGGITPPPTGGQNETLPPQAASQLQEGVQHTFNNGQVWTKQGGKPVRIK